MALGRPPRPPPAPQGSPTSRSVAQATFPPAIAEVEGLLLRLPADPSSSQAVRPHACQDALHWWRDAVVAILEEVGRGSAPDAPPIDEVWHWLTSSERLMRILSFAEHSATLSVAAQVINEGGEGGAEVVQRWQDAVHQLKQLEKESAWNARYLRVVEAPLTELCNGQALVNGSLPQLVVTLLRSLHRIYSTSLYFKEHRMAVLLHKTLKVLISQACQHVPCPYAIASSDGAVAQAWSLSKAFQSAFAQYIDHYFIVPEAGEMEKTKSSSRSSSLSRRPATAPEPSSGRSSRPTSSRRRDGSDLGWWRATARCTLEQAQHCRDYCGSIAKLLEAGWRISISLPSLRTTDANLAQEVEGFIALHSGLKGSKEEDTSSLLDLQNQVRARLLIDEVTSRIDTLVSKVLASGVAMVETELVPVQLQEAALLSTDTTQSVADVLTLSGDGQAETTTHVAVPGSGQGAMNEEISSMQAELQQFEEELRNISTAMHSGKVPQRTNGTAAAARLDFAPAPRGHVDGGGDAPEQGEPGRSRSNAFEVARRSSWYVAPPPVVSTDVEWRDVQQNIAMTRITRCPSRPRTSQPRLFVTTQPATNDPEQVSDTAEDQAATNHQEEQASFDVTDAYTGGHDSGTLEPGVSNAEDDDEESESLLLQNVGWRVV